MVSKFFKIKIITSKNCFCHVSDRNINKFPLQSCIKVNRENDKIFYFSIGSHSPNLKENELGIDGLYAKVLELQDGAVIEATIVENIATVKSLSITPCTSDDYQVLELLSENVQNILLSHITIASEGQKIIVWISSSLHVIVNIEKVEPISVGRLENLTEVIILIPESSNKHESKIDMAEKKNTSIFDIFRNRVSLNDPTYILKKYRKEIVPKCFSLHLVTDLIKLFNTKTFSHQFFDVFITRNSLSTILSETNYSDVLLFSLKIIQPPVSQGFVDENLLIKIITVRVCIIEDYFENYSFESNILPVMFANKCLFDNFDLKPNAKVILYNPSKPHLYDIESVFIATKSDNVTVIEEKFKKYLAENCRSGPVLLNSDFVIPLEDDKMFCSLKFEPSKTYCLIDSASLRGLKVNVVEKDVDLVRNEVNSTENDCEFCVENVQFEELFENISNILKTTVNSGFQQIEGIILSGKTGSGKTTFLKILKKKSSNFPSRFYFEFIDCRRLKGKSIDSLIRLFISKIINLIYYQPSVLILDDLQTICSKVEGDVQTQDSVQTVRISEVIRDFLSVHLQNNKIQVIATCESDSEINENLLPSRGKKLFSYSYKIEDLSERDKVNIMHFLFSKKVELIDVNLEKYASQMDGYVMQDLVDFVNKAIFESLKEDFAETPKVFSKHCDRALAKFTSLSLREVHLDSPGDKDFSDIGGMEDIKNILIECMSWPIQFPSLFASAPLRLQSGILLYGPPGTGKTLIAKAAAKQCGLRLISVKGPELLSKYIGASEQAVRNVFEKAQSIKPCVLFFDEFDSLAPRRGHDSTGVTDRVVNQLLTQLDGVEGLSGICVLAATSRPDLLDSALLRPGRLDKQIFCPLPNEETRLSILKALSKSFNFSSEVNLLEIASITANYSGADLQGVLVTAYLMAVEETMNLNKDDLNEDPVITGRHLEKALADTNPSLSNEERSKYEKIYSKFQGRTNPLEFGFNVQRSTLA